LEEIDLIKRARQGDQAVWITLVGEHQEAIFRLAYLILGDPDDAKDIAQETFMRAFRSLDSFDEHRPLKPWLLRIATNLSRNQRRASGRYWAALTRFGRREIDEKRNVAEEASTQLEKSRTLWAGGSRSDLFTVFPGSIGRGNRHSTRDRARDGEIPPAPQFDKTRSRHHPRLPNTERG
jgi:RNA polymerase sigma factor (sigma-70 family)